MIKRLRAAAVLLLALAGVFLATGGPAAAAPGDPFYVYTEPYLTGSPTGGMNPVCKSGRISLAAGTYAWQEAVGHTGTFDVVWQSASRNIYLGAGPYTVTICIYPKPGAYLLQATLLRDGGTPAYLNSSLFNLNSGTWRIWTKIQLV